jgi:hypothetical protein
MSERLLAYIWNTGGGDDELAEVRRMTEAEQVGFIPEVRATGLYRVDSEARVRLTHPDGRGWQAWKHLPSGRAILDNAPGKHWLPGGGNVAYLLTEEQYQTLKTEYEQAVTAYRAKQEAIRSAGDQKRLAAFAEAKRTGEPQPLESWMAPCGSRGVECSTDFVCEYAMPDGTAKIERQHTF